jgi:hypothetical protein
MPAGPPRVVQLSRLCLWFGFGVTLFFASFAFVGTFTIMGGSGLYGSDAALSIGLALLGVGLWLNYRRHAVAPLAGVAGALAAPVSIAVIASLGDQQPNALWMAAAILGATAVAVAALLTGSESRAYFARP